MDVHTLVVVFDSAAQVVGSGQTVDERSETDALDEAFDVYFLCGQIHDEGMQS